MAKKRKREVSDEEKLVHESTKTLRRAAKKAKAFEVQKAVRRLKDARAAGRDDAGAAAQVDDCKAVDLDAVVALCLRRCGVANVGSAHEGVVAAVEGHAATKRVVLHAAVVAASRDVDAAATKHRRAALLKADPVLRREARAEAKARAKREKKATNRPRHDAVAAIFVDALDGSAPAEELAEAEEEDDPEALGIVKPKNRVGSRRRRELREAAAQGDARAANAMLRGGLKPVRRGEGVTNGPRARPKPPPVREAAARPATAARGRRRGGAPRLLGRRARAQGGRGRDEVFGDEDDVRLIYLCFYLRFSKVRVTV